MSEFTSGRSLVCRRVGRGSGRAVGAVAQSSSRMRGTEKRCCSCCGRRGERGLGAERRADLVGAGDVGQRQRVRHRLDVVGGHLLHLGDGLEDDAQLADHAVELGVGQVDAGEAGEVRDVVPGQCGHDRQSRGAV